MSNMSYCRFQNTLSDLRDCEENLNDSDLSKEEHNARKRLIELCLSIVENAYSYDHETYEYEPDGDWNKDYKEDE